MSRAPQPDGSERLYLHAGYFETLADAERCAAALYGHYPNAFATIAPVALSQPANSGAPAFPPAAARPVAPQSNDPAPARDESLTDTAVMNILETRRASAAEDDVEERHCDQVALLRPEDTGTRQALKEAVAQGAPVSFALQLHWSAQPIDLSSVPPLAIFKPYTLYATESRREGRSRHFLRLGFFADPISAKQVAVQLRSTYASAAVVPVLEPEVTRAREASMGNSAIPYFVRLRVEPGIDSTGTAGSPARSKRSGDAPRRVSRGAEAAETDPDSLSESGVRHLRVEVQHHSTGRWRIIHLAASPPESGHAGS